MTGLLILFILAVLALFGYLVFIFHYSTKDPFNTTYKYLMDWCFRKLKKLRDCYIESQQQDSPTSYDFYRDNAEQWLAKENADGKHDKEVQDICKMLSKPLYMCYFFDPEKDFSGSLFHEMWNDYRSGDYMTKAYPKPLLWKLGQWHGAIEKLGIDYSGLYTAMKDSYFSGITFEEFKHSIQYANFSSIMKSARDKGSRSGKSGCIYYMVSELGDNIGKDWLLSAAESVCNKTGQDAITIIRSHSGTEEMKKFEKVLLTYITNYKPRKKRERDKD